MTVVGKRANLLGLAYNNGCSGAHGYKTKLGDDSCRNGDCPGDVDHIEDNTIQGIMVTVPEIGTILRMVNFPPSLVV